MNVASDHAEFPETAWTCIRIVQDADHPEHVEAVNRFIKNYWKPVFCFLRANGKQFAAAEDLTQDFFLRFVLERKWVQNAEQRKGRFRSFLLTVLKRFDADHGIGRTTNQDRFERRFVSISALMVDEDRSFEPLAGDTPDAIFNRQWASAVLSIVRAQLRERFTLENRQNWIELFDAYHGSDGKRPSQQALATHYGLSRDEVRQILAKVQKRMDRLLRSEIREQVGSEADVDDEIRDMVQIMGPPQR